MAAALKTFRAASMADALKSVKNALGPSAIILNTRTFKEGGVFGVGAKNIVEITAAPEDANLPRRTLRSTPAAGPNRQAGVPQTLGSATPRVRLDPRLGARLGGPDRADTRWSSPQTPSAAFRPDPSAANSPETNRPDSSRPEPASPPSNVKTAHSAPESVGREPAFGRTVRTEGRGRPVPTSRMRELERAKTEFQREVGRVPPYRHADRRPTDNHHAGHHAVRPDCEPAAHAVVVEPGATDAVEARNTRLDRLRVPAPLSPADSASSEALREELTIIRRMVGQVLRSSRSPAAAAAGVLPDAAFDLYQRLMEADTDPEIAERLIGRVRDELSPGELAEEAIVKQALLREIAAELPVVGEAPRAEPGEGELVALIGPTGVGKTTTLAKLAATYKLRRGKSVGLVTCDTYRIAAVEQLRTYADIIGLPLRVAHTPADVADARRELADCDLVLLDTPGRSQHDASRLSELHDLLDAASPTESHLVLSASASPGVLRSAVERFGELGPTRLLVTKLDEAVALGPLLTVAALAQLPISFVTTGQEVPDHIQLAQSDRLARQILSPGSPAGASPPDTRPTRSRAGRPRAHEHAERHDAAHETRSVAHAERPRSRAGYDESVHVKAINTARSIDAEPRGLDLPELSPVAAGDAMDAMHDSTLVAAGVSSIDADARAGADDGLVATDAERRR